MADDGNPLKILLVDDEMLVRAGTAMMLEELGHEVSEAGTAAQALELFSNEAGFDLVITDYRMPEMDGMAMLAEMRKANEALPAILMTGYEPDDPRFENLDCANLAKPFGLDELEQAVIASGAKA